MVDMELEDMQKFGVSGFIRFGVKAVDNELNREVHEAFRSFCRIECENDYTQGLKLLLERSGFLDIFGGLEARISVLEAKLDEKSKEVSKEEVEDGGTF
jgi:hypothetical protein